METEGVILKENIISNNKTIKPNGTIQKIGNTLKSNIFKCSDFALKVMKNGKIIGPNETPEDMIVRIVKHAGIIESRFGTSKEEREKWENSLMELLFNKIFVPSTPIMTNLGRNVELPLSACTVPPLNLKDDFSKIKKTVDELHEQGMGTGFNFDDVEDPIGMLKYLNTIAKEGEKSGKQERPVGNMGIMSVYNPHILEFIQIKNNADQYNEHRIFNISINVDEDFMNKAKKREDIVLRDGKIVNAGKIIDLIAKSCHLCGDPGLVFFDRVNDGNLVPSIGEYSSLAPCGEVGLTKGESCQFGYINISEIVEQKGNIYEISYNKLQNATEVVTRFLDNTLEYSIEKMTLTENKDIMQKKRKIGIGICGFADMLIKLGVSYGSEEAVRLVEDITSFINLHSKKVSVQLAKERGAFGAFEESKYKNGKSYIMQRYGDKSTRVVKEEDRKTLDNDIKNYGIRNCSTIAYPPTGRSSLAFDTSAQIEPIFNIFDNGGELRKDILDKIISLDMSNEEKADLKDQIYKKRSIKCIENKEFKELFKTATELTIDEHLNIVIGCQRFIDEGVSKTVNLPRDTTEGKIKEVYLKAFEGGLKGITVFRDGSKIHQPKSLMGKRLLSMVPDKNEKEYHITEGMYKIREIIEDKSKELASVLLAVGGGVGSGKTSIVTSQIEKRFSDKITVVHMDDYYKDEDMLRNEGLQDINRDDPYALDFDKLMEDVKALRNGQKITKPIYDFALNKRISEETVEPQKIILLEGIFMLNELFDEYSDYKIFVDSDPSTRLLRVLIRDIVRKNLPHKEILKRYYYQTKGMHEQYVEPTKKNADIILKNDLNIDKELNEKGLSKLFNY